MFVGGLSYRVRERDLEKFFQKIGRVMDISMKNGYAFVVSVILIALLLAVRYVQKYSSVDYHTTFVKTI